VIPKPDPARRALEERRRYALRDLEELEQQVAEGELDEETAADLEARYRRELQEAEDGLAALPPEQRPAVAKRKKPAAGAVAARKPDERTKPLPLKGLAIIGGIAAVLTVAIVIIGTSGGEETASSPATVTPTTAAPDGQAAPAGDQLAQMEAAVAANPEASGMRLALAGLYFDRGDYIPAMDHYLAVIDNDPTTQQEALAVSRVGWMAYLTGQPATAVEYLRSAIELDPANGEAKLFLGVVLLYGLEDAEAAIPVLEEVLALPDLPATLRPDVENMLAEARSQEPNQ
jgi:tetratricopeptide (TPR) repeat protein